MDSKKTFDAVAESRKWRIATGKELSGMTQGERLSYLNDGIDAKLEALTSEPDKAVKSARKSKRTVLA